MPMPDKRKPTGITDSSLNTASTLIARREATVKRSFTGTGGSTTAGTTATTIDDLNEWVDDTGQSWEAIGRMEQVRQQFWNTYKRLMAWSLDYTRLRILHGLVEHRLGVTYDTLEDYVDVSRRTLKKHVGTLADMDVVERDGNPAQIRFTDEERYLLAVDATATEQI